MALSAQEQLDAKTRVVQRALDRPVDQVLPSPRALGYRARVRLTVGPTGALGYSLPRSHTHLPIEGCPVARPELERALVQVQQELPDARPLQRLELRSDGQRVVVNGMVARPRHNKAARSLLKRLSLPTALDGRRVTGDPTLQLTVRGVSLRLSAGSFYQINLELNEQLVELVEQQVMAFEPDTVLDLYAGVGNLSLPLAARGVKVVQLESAPSSSADATHNALPWANRVTALRQNAGRFRAGDQFFDLALLDPPRAGAPGVVKQLLLTRPKGIVYVSCNPHTLSRDIRPALAAGYSVRHLAALDMFPQTPHVEALCVLGRD